MTTLHSSSNEITTNGHPKRRDQVLLAHGGGGQLTDELLSSHVLPRLGNDILDELLDAANLGRHSGRLAITIDSFVVQPWRFPGGDIGRLAVAGTVNDLAVSGAKPVGIALAMIIAEGFPLANLDIVMQSIADTAKDAGVRIVTGDTKVVGHGQADGIYLITAGVGITPLTRRLSPTRVSPGDVLIVNGAIGEHGLSVMLQREMPDLQSAVKSDVAPLNGLIETVLAHTKNAVTFMRDPTRGGVAGLCADLAQRSGYHIVLEESAILVRPGARHAAEMLGLDPLEIANEGKVVIAVKPRHANDALAALKSHPLGIDASIIGVVDKTRDGLCELRTNIGGRRIVQKPYGEQLPRIC